jgi:hypothetical protein
LLPRLRVIRSMPLPHDPEKACPGLDPGFTDFSDKIMRKTKKIGRKIASI